MDFTQQKKALESISAAITTKLNEAVTLAKTLPTVEEELMRKRASIEAAKAEEKKKLEDKKGCAGCLGTTAVVVLISSVFALAASEKSEDTNGSLYGHCRRVGFRHRCRHRLF